MANGPLRISGLTGALTFDESVVNAGPQRLDANVSVSASHMHDGVLRVSGLLPEDRVGLATDGVIAVSEDTVLYNGIVVGRFTGGVGTSFSVRFSEAATAPAIEAVIERLTYRNVSDTPTATRTLSLSIEDAKGNSAQPGFSATPDANGPFDGINLIQASTPVLIDLNGDGHLDLVSGSWAQREGDTFVSRVRAYLGNADGSFSTTPDPDLFKGITPFIFGAPSFIDVNGDGRIDLVLRDANSSLSTFLRKDDGSFDTSANTSFFGGIDTHQAQAISFADIDLDGRSDLVVGSRDGTIRTFLRKGDGSFDTTEAPSFFTGIGIDFGDSLTFGDLNGDGRIDLVMGRRDGTVQAYLRNEDGSFATIADPHLFDGIDVGQSSTPTLADLNGDGRLDLVSGTWDGKIRSFTNGAGQSITINVTPQNDVPVLAGVSGSLALRQDIAGRTAQRLFASASFTDGDFNAGTLEVRGAVAGDRIGLALDAVIGIDGTAVLVDGIAVGTLSRGIDTLAVTFNAAANAAAVTAVLQHLTYQALGDTPAASRSLQVVVTDGSGLTASQPVLDVVYDLAPRVTGIAYGSHDGILRAGERVTFTVAFSERVTVAGGVPGLILSDGGTATYVSGSGTDSLVFSYTVGRGRNTGDLSVAGIDLGGGTIRDGIGQNTLALPRGGIDPDGVLVVDTLAPAIPTLDGTAAGGASLHTSRPLLTGIGEAGSRISIYVDGRFQDTVATDTQGRFSFTPEDSLGLGRHTVTVFATDAAGNMSDFRTDSVTVLGETLTGTSGADTLASRTGDDLLIGLDGDDTYRVDSAGDVVREALDGGTDTVVTSVSYTLGAGQEIEILRGWGKAGLTLTGNEFANRIVGGAGNDVLDGGRGIDTLLGQDGDDIYIVDHARDRVIEAVGGGNDTVRASVSYILAAGQEIEILRTTSDSGRGPIDLTGNAFATTIVGNGGANVITGGGGADILTGRGGADTFVFRTLADSTLDPAGRDTITDFSRAQGDRIDLQAIDAVAGGVVNQAFRFIGDTDFRQRAGELRAEIRDGDTLVGGDVDGDGRADFSILLKGALTLHGSDFIL